MVYGILLVCATLHSSCSGIIGLGSPTHIRHGSPTDIGIYNMSGRAKAYGDVQGLVNLLGPFVNSSTPWGYTTDRKMASLDKTLLLSEKYQAFFRAGSQLRCDKVATVATHSVPKKNQVGRVAVLVSHSPCYHILSGAGSKLRHVAPLVTTRSAT